MRTDDRSPRRVDRRDWRVAATRPGTPYPVPGARFPDPDSAADGGGPAGWRGVLVAGRQASGLPERTGAGQPLLSDLRARPRDRRDPPNLQRDWQDDVRVL